MQMRSRLSQQLDMLAESAIRGQEQRRTALSVAQVHRAALEEEITEDRQGRRGCGDVLLY